MFILPLSSGNSQKASIREGWLRDLACLEASVVTPLERHDPRNTPSNRILFAIGVAHDHGGTAAGAAVPLDELRGFDLGHHDCSIRLVKICHTVLTGTMIRWVIKSRPSRTNTQLRSW